ncbi:hypothetical protein [Yinghuangia sp. YIM S09857]|uniref:hypothetical protein n=1 Tax=Yinghuangia sp. YIM S09857 TaxID=3436929 RepID=UPI003F529B65
MAALVSGGVFLALIAACHLALGGVGRAVRRRRRPVEVRVRRRRSEAGRSPSDERRRGPADVRRRPSAARRRPAQPS